MYKYKKEYLVLGLLLLMFFIIQLSMFTKQKDIENQLITTSKEKEELAKVLEELQKEYNNKVVLNESLEKEYKELIERINNYEKANVAMENTIKKMSEAGTKPQNYNRYPSISRSGLSMRKRYLGEWEGTFYTPSIEECGSNLGITASGSPIIAGYSIAADVNKWPIGTILEIEGLGIVQVMDTGGAIKGDKKFDFAVFDKERARNLGNNKFKVYLIKLGNGSIDEV